MKKLMIAAAIVCAAAMSQAASINWGGTTEWAGGTYEGYANEGAIYSLYLVEGTVGDITTYNKDTGALTVGGKELTAVSTYKPNPAEIENGGFLAEYVNDAANLNGKNLIAVVYDPESVADKFAAAVYGVSGLDDGGQTKNLLFDGTGDSNFTTTTDLAYATPQEGVVSVPEPTSGLLLLLGVAGLALRRRRA